MDKVHSAVVRAYRRLADWRILLVLLLLVLPFWHLFARSAASFTNLGGPTHSQMEFKASASDWETLWSEYTGDIEHGLQDYRMHLLRLDFVFPVLYVMLLLSAIAFLTKEPKKEPPGWVLILFLLPALGGVFDFAENVMHISLLLGVERVEELGDIPGHLVRLSFAFTVLKWVLIVVPLAGAILVKLYREYVRMDKQTRDLKDPDDLKRLKGVYTKDLRTVIKKEEDYISARREKAAKELLVTERDRLKARAGRADSEKLRRINVWLNKEKAYAKGPVNRRESERRLGEIEKGSAYISARWVREAMDCLQKHLDDLKDEVATREDWRQTIADFAKERDPDAQEQHLTEFREKEEKDLRRQDKEAAGKQSRFIQDSMVLRLSAALRELDAQLERMERGQPNHGLFRWIRNKACEFKRRLARGYELEVAEETLEELRERRKRIRAWLDAPEDSDRLQIERGSRYISSQRVYATRRFLDKRLLELRKELQKVEQWHQALDSLGQDTPDRNQIQLVKTQLPVTLLDEITDRLFEYLAWGHAKEIEEWLRAEKALEREEEKNKWAALERSLRKIERESKFISTERVHQAWHFLEDELSDVEEKIAEIAEWHLKWLGIKAALDSQSPNREGLEKRLQEIEEEGERLCAQREYAVEGFPEKELSDLQAWAKELEEWLQIAESFATEEDEDKRAGFLEQFRKRKEEIADKEEIAEKHRTWATRDLQKEIRRGMSKRLSKLSESHVEFARSQVDEHSELVRHLPEINEWLHVKRYLDEHKSRQTRMAKQRRERFNECNTLILPGDGAADRRPIGLAFSGGGIRSATFNLGLVQGLAKYGMLPWVDYLTSVSGGGFTAACMTALLSMDKKDKKGNREYYYFNTQWDRFPFNPELKVFDGEGVAHVEEPTGEVGPPLEKGTNAQLTYLRNRGNWLIPRLGWATRDTLRTIGTFLVRPSYTILVFLLVIVTCSAFHYGVTAALTPSILKNIDLSALGKVEEPTQLDLNLRLEDREFVVDLPSEIPEEPTQLNLNLRLEDREFVVDLPLEAPEQQEGVSEGGETEAETPKQQEDVPEGGEAEEFTLLYLIIGDYDKDPKTVSPKAAAAPIPTDKYLQTLAAGLVFSFLIGSTLRLFYRHERTRKYRLNPWKRPEKDMSKDTYLAIEGLRIFAGVAFLLLFLLTLWLWVSRYQMLPPQSETDLSQELVQCRAWGIDFLRAWGFLFVPFGLTAGWFVFKYTKDRRWVKQGLPEQLRIDTLAMHTAAALFVWVMILVITWLRFPAFGKSGPQIFWIWMPAVFALGSVLGLALFRNLPLRHHVVVQKGAPFEEGIGPLEKAWLNLILGKKSNDSIIAKRGSDFKLSIWSNLEFRSMFSALQGLALYGLIAFLLLAFLALPHYFSTEPRVSLATAIISAGWAALLSRKADVGSKNLIAKVLTLPGRLGHYVLGLLVIVLNLSIIFFVESRLDSISALHSLGIGLAALVVLYIIGKIFDFNYLSPHYFYRDRIAEVCMKTEVMTEAGQVVVARDQREERLNWITPGDPRNVPCSAPYHIVLTALNLPGSWHLEPKDRKSQPFIFSKHYCGSKITGYAKTYNYRGGITRYARAIALSGAGISPGLGYHTFFAQAFMTTLLNVRLGLWMISPEQYNLDTLGKYAKLHQIERRVFWPTYLWDEARAQISERRPLINLTDGEHTGDGIGLYSLFERRCKVIIAGDAGGEPAGHGRGLFCVLRQVKVDMGIEVDIKVDGTKPEQYDPEEKVAKPSKRHFAVGTIKYPATFDDQGNQVLPEQDGWLIYFKPAVTKMDPGGILSYWETHKMEFPVPSTADQFFEEEQYEVQRWLGEITIERTLEELKGYYDKKIEEEQEKWAKDQDKIAELTIRSNLLKRLLEDKSMDFDFLHKHPEILEEFVNTLYTISKGPDDESEA